MKPNPVCFTKQKFRFEEGRERERERERERDFGRVNMREFLFGNSQIGSMSQGLISKTSCIELGTPHETQPYLL